MSAPTRFPNGVTNARINEIFGKMGQLDPTTHHTYFNDFDTYVVGDWTITTTEAGGGDATEALLDGDGGLLLITNDAADNDADFFQKVGESFLFTAGKKAFFKARFKVSDATQSDFVMGLQVTDTTPLSVTDGVYFQKDDGDTQLDIYCRKDATTGSTSATNIFTVTTAFMVVAFYYDGVDKLFYAVNGDVLGHLDASSSFLPDTELTISFGIQNGEAVAKTMTIDYIFAAMER